MTTTDDDVKAQIAFHRDRIAQGKSKLTLNCKKCGTSLVYVPYDHAVEPGHIYSVMGVKEVDMTGWCEWCFDEVTKEPEEDEGPNPDALNQ